VLESTCLLSAVATGSVLSGFAPDLWLSVAVATALNLQRHSSLQVGVNYRTGSGSDRTQQRRGWRWESKSASGLSSVSVVSK